MAKQLAEMSAAELLQAMSDALEVEKRKRAAAVEANRASAAAQREHQDAARAVKQIKQVYDQRIADIDKL